MDAYYALILQHEKGLQVSNATKPLMYLTIQCDVTLFPEGKILPVVIVENETAYKLTEAKVVKQNLLTVDIELHIKQGMNFNPMFDVRPICYPLCKVTSKSELRQIPNYLDYDTIQCLHIGSRYRR